MSNELEVPENTDIQMECENNKQEKRESIEKTKTCSTSGELRINSNDGHMEIENAKTEEKSVPCVKESSRTCAMEIDNGQLEVKTLPPQEINMELPNLEQNEGKQKVLKRDIDSRGTLQTTGVNSSAGVKNIPKNDKISQDSQKENKSNPRRSSHLVGVEKTDQSHPLSHIRVTVISQFITLLFLPIICYYFLIILENVFT